MLFDESQYETVKTSIKSTVVDGDTITVTLPQCDPITKVSLDDDVTDVSIAQIQANIAQRNASIAALQSCNDNATAFLSDNNIV